MHIMHIMRITQVGNASFGQGRCGTDGASAAAVVIVCYDK